MRTMSSGVGISLEVEGTGANGALERGKVMRGSVEFGLGEEVKAKKVVVYLVGKLHGMREQEAFWFEKKKIIERGKVVKPFQNFKFSFPVPAYPLPFDGAIINLRWCLMITANFKKTKTLYYVRELDIPYEYGR